MKVIKPLLWILAAAGFAISGPVFAESGADLVKDKKCLTCHDVEKKKVGPSFKDIAAKFKDDKDAHGKLAEKLKNGKGHMKISASDAEIKAMLDYVLSTK